MRSSRLFWLFLTGLQASLLASCILAKSKSKEGSESEATNEVEVSGSIADEEPIEFVKASDSVSISGVNLIAAVSYDVTAYSVDAAGVKTVIFSGSFAEPKFQFKSNVPKRYILLEIIRQPDGGKYGAVLPPPTSGKKASMVVDGTTTIAAKLAEAVTEKAASGDFNSRKALADGNISVADLLMVSQSVRRTVVEQKEQNKGSSIDLSVLATNLVIKSNDFVSRLYAEGQTPADVSQKISEATYQTVFGEYATIAAPGILAYRTRPDLGTSEASQINVAYEAIKLSPSESMITVDQAFRVEATAYRTASSVTAAVASQSQVTSTFKTVFESCVQTPSSCSGTSYTPPPAPTSQTSGSTPTIPVISITSQPASQSISCAVADFAVTASVSQGASLTYQWQKKDNGSSSFVNLNGKTERTLRLTGLKYSVDHGDEFRVVIRTADGVSIIVSRSAALTIRLPEKPVLMGFPSTNYSGHSTEVQYAPLQDVNHCVTQAVIEINGVKSQSPATWLEEERVFGTDEAAEGDTLRFAFVGEVGEGPMSDPITVPVSCETIDCYKIGSAPNFTQDLPVGTERGGPGNSLMTLQYANGISGFKIWKEKNGTRILNATGRIVNGWQKELTRAGTAFSATDFTMSSIIAGRVCPPNVFLNHSNMTATDRCLYYDANIYTQSLDADTLFGANSTVWSLLVQRDGKILAGGSFTSYKGVTRNGIARLNSNGTLDTSFDIGIGFNSFVTSLAVQADGKILAGGIFTSYKGVTRNCIARLNSNGTLDTSFDIGNGFDMSVTTISVQEDGKILVGGEFITYNGTSKNRIARLNSNGSLDTSFDVGTGFDGNVASLAVQGDGKILAVGAFTSYKGVTRNRIARLNSNGTLDTSFDIGIGFNGSGIGGLAVQADGKILVGGLFSGYNTATLPGIARLNSNGTLDTSFDTGAGFHPAVRTLTVQGDGKILVGGAFTTYNGTTKNRIARLNIDGSYDTSFDVGTGFGSDVYTIAVREDGKILVAGDFVAYNGNSKKRIVLLNSDGTVAPFGTSGYEAEDWLAEWSQTNTGRGTLSSYYEGNIKTCADKGMRLPTLYETSGTSNPYGGNTYQPTGDLVANGGSLSSHPSFAGANGVPSQTYLIDDETSISWTWTASAMSHSNRADLYWSWAENTEYSTDTSMDANPFLEYFLVRCVLP